MLFTTLLPLVSSTAIFAPYADITGSFDHTPYSEAGVKLFTMAFANVICSSSTPVLGQSLAYDARVDWVKSVRQSGGDVIMSFGGAWQDSAKDPATCGFNATHVQQLYQVFIDTYNLTFIDLDVEGACLDDTVSIDIRSTALAALKTANPGLKISLTLPVAVTGMLGNALYALESAKSAGLALDYVNIMAMCYGPSVEQMGDAAISAAAGSVLQLERLQMTSTKLGVTPMIKKNDGNSGTFTLEDAVKLTEYSKGNSNISMLSFWQLSADFNLEYTYKFLGIDGTTMTPRLSTNVCGIDWTDAATTCAIACPSGTDSECPTGQKCMDISSSTTCAGVNPDGGDLGSGNSTTSSGSGGLNATQTSIGSSSTFPPYGNQMIMAVCGSDLADAESSCAIACPNKVDMDCPYGQKCFDISHSTSCLGIAPVGSNSSSTVSVTSSGTTTASATNTTSGTGYTTGTGNTLPASNPAGSGSLPGQSYSGGTGNTLPASNPAGSGSLPGQSYTTGNTLPVSNPTDSGSLPVSGYPSEPDPNAAAAPNAAIPDPAEYDLLEDCEPEIAPAATDLPIFSSDIKLGSGYFGIFVIMLLAI